MTDLLVAETDGLAIDFTGTDDFNSSTWAQTLNQKRASSVDVFSSPHTFYTNSGTSPKIVKTSATGLGWSPHNIVFRSQEQDNAYWTSSNGTWTADNLTAPDGTSTGDTFTANATDAGGMNIFRSGGFATVSGFSYCASAYFKAGTVGYAIIYLTDAPFAKYVGQYINLSTGALGGTDNVTWTLTSAVQDVGNGWYRLSVGTTVDTTSIRVYLYSSANGTTGACTIGDSIGIWGQQLNRGLTPNAYIATTTASKYGLPISYGEGLLCEPAATNLQSRSQEFDNVFWTKANVTVTADDTTAPDGTTTAEKVTVSAGSAIHNFFDTTGFTVSASTNYTMSAYLKAGTLRRVQISNVATSTQWFSGIFDLVNGRVTQTAAGSSGTVTGSSIKFIGNGWYLCSVTGTVTGTSSNFCVETVDTDTPVHGTFGDVTWTADGSETFWVWGVQFELGSVPSSYVPTVSASATRATDAVNVATSAYPHSATNGTFVVWPTKRIVNATNADVIANLNDATANEVISLRVVTGDTPDSFGVDIIDGGAAQVASTVTKSGTVTTDGNKVGFLYKANDSAILANTETGTETADAACTMPTVTNLQLGYAQDTASRELNGFIRRLLYVPRRLVTADLWNVTANGRFPATTVTCLLTQNDGTSFFLLNDGTSKLTLYVCPAAVTAKFAAWLQASGCGFVAANVGPAALHPIENGISAG